MISLSGPRIKQRKLDLSEMRPPPVICTARPDILLRHESCAEGTIRLGVPSSHEWLGDARRQQDVRHPGRTLPVGAWLGPDAVTRMTMAAELGEPRHPWRRRMPENGPFLCLLARDIFQLRIAHTMCRAGRLSGGRPA